MNPYHTRLRRVQDAMAHAGIDLMYLNYGPDMTYVSGIVAPLYYYIMKSPGDWITGLIISLDRPPVLVLQKAFAVNVTTQTWIDDIRIMPDTSDPDRFLADVLHEFAPAGKTIALGKMVWAQTALSLRAAAPDARFIAATNTFMDQIRVIKDPDEIALMQKAAEITDIALTETVARMRIGMTERDVAIELDYQMRRHGGDGPSFYPGIICVGNGSDPQRHIFTRNTDMILAAGTSVAFDYGTLYQGYCSDFGRSVFMGEPHPEALAAYRSITTNAQKLFETMGDGRTTPLQICNHMAELMTADGFGEYYMVYGLGHSIGLEVHEEPWLKPPYDEPIREGMIFTIEPKVWKPGVFYVRCEDVVLVGADRGTPLTRSTYEPIVITT
ncbi:MAG TPA: Xaa-Pro peptidase family protein [Roseiflexaceae bacterium]|nr:Xaa-Pro peptidase family protein [Roseiflexaceae bacterium]HMP39952.1 Xaa-Pro peptidase family protein [Roseiflexaceae bacterium]